MKKLTFAFIALSLFAGAASANGLHGCSDNNVIYTAYTMKGTKAVELCQVPDGFRYSFGPAGKAEISVTQPASNVTFYGSMAGGFEFKNGNIEYSVLEDKFGNAELGVRNLKTFKTLAIIELDTIDDAYVNETHLFR